MLDAFTVGFEYFERCFFIISKMIFQRFTTDDTLHHGVAIFSVKEN